jgi:hypothetical protein
MGSWRRQLLRRDAFDLDVPVRVNYLTPEYQLHADAAVRIRRR